MYEELVTALLETRERVKSNPSVAMYVPPYQLSAAADAIEELSKQIKNWEDALKTALDYIPCWVSVTERLPESMHEYVLCCGEKGGQFVGWIVMGMLVNGKARAFQHGGKGRYITHWMPLPPAPEPTEDDAPSGPYDLLYEEGGANTT